MDVLWNTGNIIADIGTAPALTLAPRHRAAGIRPRAPGRVASQT
jgi:hypothetical protein